MSKIQSTLINELDTIDLHQASYSADPPYTVLEVIGTPISERLKDELSHYGFNKFQPTGEGLYFLGDFFMGNQSRIPCLSATDSMQEDLCGVWKSRQAGPQVS